MQGFLDALEFFEIMLVGDLENAINFSAKRLNKYTKENVKFPSRDRNNNEI